MSLVFLVAFLWLSMRTVLLLAQVQRHTPEAQLGRAFQEELNNRGLTLGPADADRLTP
jgi:hypothetical protein